MTQGQAKSFVVGHFEMFAMWDISVSVVVKRHLRSGLGIVPEDSNRDSDILETGKEAVCFVKRDMAADFRNRDFAMPKSDFVECDVIATMENTHRQHLLRTCPPNLQKRVSLLMSFAAERPVADIPDPYYGDDGFEDVFRMIERGVVGLLDHIRQTHVLAPTPRRSGT